MYFVHYVEDCTPKLKSFTSKQKMESFLKSFSKKEDHENGYWIDFSFHGKVLTHNPYYDKAIKRSKR